MASVSIESPPSISLALVPFVLLDFCLSSSESDENSLSIFLEMILSNSQSFYKNVFNAFCGLLFS